MVSATTPTTTDSYTLLPEISDDLFFELTHLNDLTLLEKMLRSDSGLNEDALTELLSFEKFLKTGVAHITYIDKYVITYLNDTSRLAIVDTETYCVYAIERTITSLVDWRIKEALSYAPCAVLLSQLKVSPQVLLSRTKVSSRNKKKPSIAEKILNERYFWLLVNADAAEGDAAYDEITDRHPFCNLVSDFHSDPCISFTCLARFYDIDLISKPKDLEKLLVKFSEGQITVTEYTEHSWLQLSKRQHEAYISKGQIPPQPAPGYTLVKIRQKYNSAGENTYSAQWHRPPVVLINDSADPKHSLLFGQDDDAYFGVELPKKARSIDQAFDALIPAEVKQAYKNKQDVDRQGEWFAVSRKHTEVVDLTEAVITFATLNVHEYAESTVVSLNRDHADSAHHYILTADGRVDSAGVVYAFDACLQHEHRDHPDLHTKGWVSYHRNTATRAFSVKGVD